MKLLFKSIEFHLGSGGGYSRPSDDNDDDGQRGG